MERRSQVAAQTFFWKGIFFLIALGSGACFTTSVSTRFPAFWELSRFFQLLIILLDALGLSIPIFMLLQKAWQSQAAWRDRLNKQRFIFALVVGVVSIALFSLLPIPNARILHQVEIEVNSVQPTKLNTVSILEIRDVYEKIIPPEKFRVEGDWQIKDHGFFISSDRPAKLSYSFSGPNGKNLQVLLQKHPEGREVDFVVDNIRNTIDSGSKTKDQQILLFPLDGTVRWRLLISFTDLVSSLGILFTCVFISSFYSEIIPLDKVTSYRLNSRQINAVFIALFLSLLSLPTLNFQGDLREFDKKFWMREPLLRGWADFRFRMLGDRLFNSMIVGKGNWLIYTGEKSLDDYQSVLQVTDEDLAVVQRKLNGLNNRLTNKGITFLVVVPPNKNTIYPEFMPPEIPVLGEQSLLDRLIASQEKMGGVKLLDLRPMLLEARKKRPVFYSTDTHWNDYGAFIGYQEILHTLQKNYPNLHSHSYDDFQEVRDNLWRGDISQNLGQINVMEETFHLKPKFNRQVRTWTATGYEANTVITTAQPDSSLPKLVMFHDSFALTLIPFLSDHFSTATYLAKAQVDEKLIDAEQPDIVIFEITERSLHLLPYLVLPE